MAKTDIIGHRGAAGSALENTLGSFKRAATIGVKTVEFDVRATKDGQIVLCHDNSLSRISDSNQRISDLTYAELQAIPLSNGETVPLLGTVLSFARKKKLAVIVEVKMRTHLEGLCLILDDYSDLNITIASFHHDVAALIRKLRPELPMYLAEQHHPITVLQSATAVNAQGIDLHYMLINPLVYILAKRWKLTIMLYTVNSPFIVRLLRTFYPGVRICTDHPERFVT